MSAVRLLHAVCLTSQLSLGTDHAGIATQLVVERLLAKEGTSRAALGREGFLERVWQWKARQIRHRVVLCLTNSGNIQETYGNRIGFQIRRLGASCDWSRERFTLDAGLSDAVAAAFCDLHARGLVYRGTYMVNWAPQLQTAVSDLEVEYSDEPGTLYHFRYPLAGGGPDDFLPVATTRPETILGDTAVAVHPEDERYAHWVGKQLTVPFAGGRTIPVIADEYVDRSFGTGVLKITPGHDPNDYAIGKRRDLAVINIMNKDGTMNVAAGPYAGLDRAECRTRLWADLRAQGLAIREEPHTLRVPRSQRGGEVIEPLVSEQWFVRMATLAEPALRALDDGQLRIIPARFEKTYSQWLTAIQDWCVSRQLWWGHRIPVWYVHDSPQAAAAAAAADGGRGASERYVVAHNEAEAQSVATERYGPGVGLCQECDVLDTWFSSGLWPFSTLGWPNARSSDLDAFYPTQVMETGHDILFFWVARMMMLGIGLTGKVPFHTVFLHGLVRDDKGRKMSKSLGNVVDPLDVVGAQGADALRFTLATGTTPGQDLNLSLEKLASNRNLTNKIWNAGKLVLLSIDALSPQQRCELADAAVFDTAQALRALPLSERWIVSRLHQLIDKSHAQHAKFDLGEAGRSASDFFWSELADWYLEASKTRLYCDDAAAADVTRRVMLYVLDRTLRLLHPFMPYVTEELWQALPHRGPALIAAPAPASGGAVDEAAIASFEALQAAVRSIRNARAEYSVEPARRVPAVFIIANAALRQDLQEEAAVLASLARLDAKGVIFAAEVPADMGSPDDAVTLLVSDGITVLLPVAGLLEPVKELARLSKQASKIQAELDVASSRLNKPSFADKAPAAVVAKAREAVEQLQAQLSAVQDKMAAMERAIAKEESLTSR